MRDYFQNGKNVRGDNRFFFEIRLYGLFLIAYFKLSSNLHISSSKKKLNEPKPMFSNSLCKKVSQMCKDVKGRVGQKGRPPQEDKSTPTLDTQLLF